MAKKSTVKVRLVPEEKTDSKFYYYAKKPTAGLKAKDKLRLKKYLVQYLLLMQITQLGLLLQILRLKL